MWSKMEELDRGRLEGTVEKEKDRNKADLESLRRDMVGGRIRQKKWR